jgi:glycosyltransferase involved in cell wall biosynthesis
MNFLFSFIIPVYNRPQEIEDLLESFLKVESIHQCEIVIVEDGSEHSCQSVVERFEPKLNISYYYKANTGPGDSRNFGMRVAKSDYFIILDSDVLLPSEYVANVKQNLDIEYVDCFGGPDKAHKSFSSFQKAVNYAMTSILTTGGIRGKKTQKKNFQPRSFNMGLSRKAFLASGGFSNIHPGEDPDLALRLQKLNYKTALFIDCFVYHKRRVSWESFALQVYKFGLVRPILNSWHPESRKIVFFFPSLFSIGLLLSVALLFFNFIWLFVLYVLYFILIILDSAIKEKSIFIALLSVCSVLVQFFGYGYAFIKSTILINLMKKNPEKLYPFLYFKY